MPGPLARQSFPSENGSDVCSVDADGREGAIIGIRQCCMKDLPRMFRHWGLHKLSDGQCLRSTRESDARSDVEPLSQNLRVLSLFGLEHGRLLVKRHERIATKLGALIGHNAIGKITAGLQQGDPGLATRHI